MLMAVPSVASAAQMRLFIDPGHGGKDPGAVSRGFKESDSNLRISKMIAQSARRQGWKVKMSRTRDKFVPLNARPRMANRWDADVFISVHANSTGKKKLGYMTIYRSNSGKQLGRRIMTRTKRLTKYKDIGNKRDVRGLAVLRGAKQPAVLIETMSVSAKAERKKLKSAKEQRRIAEAVVRGIARYRGVEYVPPKDAKEQPKAKKAAKKDGKAAKKAPAKKAGKKKTEKSKAEKKNRVPAVESTETPLLTPNSQMSPLGQNARAFELGTEGRAQDATTERKSDEEVRETESRKVDTKAELDLPQVGKSEVEPKWLNALIQFFGV